MSTAAGTLIVESLTDDAVIDVPMTVTRIARRHAGDLAAGQPQTWTFVEFDVAAAEAEQLAAALERSLRPAGGWYCDFHTDDLQFVVFAGRTFSYRRGDARGRQEAVEHGRSVGVPEPQLDWPD